MLYWGVELAKLDLIPLNRSGRFILGIYFA